MEISRNHLAQAIRLGLFAGIFAGVGAGFASPVLAQDEEDAEQDPTEELEAPDLDRVTVTGSRIQRAGIDTFFPAVTVDAQLLEDRAFTNVADALNEIPTFGNPVATPLGTQDATNVGQNFVNFLGLGAQRTLTLVNGRRFVSANTPLLFSASGGGLVVDFNVIPVALVDRIETVGVGGAPIYGSDAIAGTVNVILNDRYEGAEFTFRKGFTSKGDAETENVLLVAGANSADGKGNVTFSAEWSREEGLPGGSRPRFSEGENDPFFVNQGADGFNLFRDQRINIFTFGGLAHPVGGGLALGAGPGREIPVPSFGIGAFPDGNFYSFAPNGDLRVFNPGNPITGMSIFFAQGGDGEDFFDRVNQISSDVDRGVFSSSMNYDLNNFVRMTADVLFSDGNAEESSNQGGFQTGAFSGSSQALTFSTDHPFLTDQARQVFTDNGIEEFVLSRFNNDIIDSRSLRDQQLWRVSGGLDGDFTIGNRVFNWEVYGVHGESDITTQAEGIIDGRFFNAIDVRQLSEEDLALVDPNTLASIGGQGQVGVGSLVCEAVFQAALDPNFGRETGAGAASTNRTFVDGCIPLNLFGEGIRSDAARDWVTAFQVEKSKNTQTVWNFNIGGDLIDLPGGSVAANVGYERRRETALFEPGASAVPFTRRAPFPTTEGNFDTDEFFVEAVIPVFGDDFRLPGFHALEINGAFRAIDNSLAGSDDVFSLGGQWQPVSDLTIRGNYTESIRAPSLVELFTPITQSFSFADDPCDRRFVNLGPNPDQRRANCIAAGIGDPDNFTSNIVNATAIGNTGGNENLSNEQAEAWSVGFSFEPRWVDNLIVGADFFDVELEDAIVNLGLTSIMVACFDATNFPNTACDQFERNEEGQVVDFLTGFTNAQALRVEVLDFFLDYRFEVADAFGLFSEEMRQRDLGFLRFNTRISRDRRREQSVTGEEIVRARRSFANPQYQGTFDLTWSRKDTRVFWRTAWQNRARLSPTQQNAFFDEDGNQVTSTRHRFISSISITQVLPRWFDFMPQDTSLQLNVDNVLRRTPTTVEQAAGHFGFAELFGRQYSLTLRTRF